MPQHATKPAKKSAKSVAPRVASADVKLGPEAPGTLRAAVRGRSHAEGAAAVSPTARHYAAQRAERADEFTARKPVEVPGALREAGQSEEDGAFTQQGAEAAIDDQKHGLTLRQEREREVAGPGRSVAKSALAGDKRLRVGAAGEHVKGKHPAKGHAEGGQAPAFDAYRREGNFVAVNKSGVKRGAHVDRGYGTGTYHAEASHGQEVLAHGAVSAGTHGVEAEGAASAAAGVFASAMGEVRSANYLGMHAGLKAEGDAFAGAKVGASGAVRLTANELTAKGAATAFAGAEASGSVRATVGPVHGKVTGAAQLGVGASLEGEFTYRRGKVIISAHAAVALGLGAGVGTSVELDIAEALHMGGEVAKFAAIAAKDEVEDVAERLGHTWHTVSHYFD